MNPPRSDRLFQWVNNSFLILIACSMLLPLVHVFVISISSPQAVMSKQVFLWPVGWNAEVYKTIFGMNTIWRSLAVTVYITVFGTAIALFLNSTLAYALIRPSMKGRKLVVQAVIVTFIFSAPLIPFYLLVRSLALENTLWALMVPGALAPFYILIMMTFFRGVSGELFEAAKIDGCNEWKIYYRIVLPLSKSVMATIALFHSVSQWNSYFSALVFIRDKSLRPLQLLVRQLIMGDEFTSMVNQGAETYVSQTPEMLKAGVVMFSVAPILLVYPFIQKHFVKGAMLGSVKE